MAGLKKARRLQEKRKALRGYKNRAVTPPVMKAAEPLSPFVMSTQTVGTQAKEGTVRTPWWENKPSGEGIK